MGMLFATLGSRLMVPKRVLKPTPQVTPALPPAFVQPEQSKLQPFYDEEAEAVRGIPPTPLESVPEKDASAMDAHGASKEAVVPAQTGLESPPTQMMPPPSTALSSGLATPMDVGADIPASPEIG